MKKHTWRDKSKNHMFINDLFNYSRYDKSSEDLFRLLVPSYYKKRIDLNNHNDPLLLQVLPTTNEQDYNQGFNDDAVGDLKSIKDKGVIHKYHGRVLLIATSACAINCRYCFRKNFPYSNNSASRNNWKNAVKYIKNTPNIHEVILSGGDPLMLSTNILNNLTLQLKEIKHIKTLRIHTRLPLVSPTRITKNFLLWLEKAPFKKVMVLHCNHPNELGNSLKKVLRSIKKTNTILLNQSVLLKNINDNHQTLNTLSHKLFDFGILPYYLNQLDKVTGTKHFQVSNSQAKIIHKKLRESLPGYLVPKLVEEISGKINKSPLF